MYSGVRSGVMVFSKPFMSGGWEGHTQRVLYYNLEKQEDKEKQQKNMTVWRKYGARETVIMENGSAPAGKKRWKTATV